MVKLSYQQASDLGTTFATGVRDIIRYTTDEANRAMNAGLPLIRFLHPSKVRGFKAMWAALLEATAIWVVCQECPEYRTNDKFVKKTEKELGTKIRKNAAETRKSIEQGIPTGSKYKANREETVNSGM